MLHASHGMQKLWQCRAAVLHQNFRHFLDAITSGPEPFIYEIPLSNIIQLNTDTRLYQHLFSIPDMDLPSRNSTRTGCSNSAARHAAATACTNGSSKTSWPQKMQFDYNHLRLLSLSNCAYPNMISCICQLIYTHSILIECSLINHPFLAAPIHGGFHLHPCP